MNQIIAIDGPAGSGKSTVSRMLAKKLNFLYLDTGAMYRAVALEVKRTGIDISDRKKLWELCTKLDLDFRTDGEKTKLYLGEEDVSLSIRSPQMDMLSSSLSTIEEVRSAMTALQRKIAANGRVVAEGRDMGTVVFPDAEHKFFVSASTEVRTERRYRERLNRGESVSLQEVANDLRQRDHQDETRAIAPLRPATDALIIDTTELNPQQVVERILSVIKGRRTKTASSSS